MLSYLERILKVSVLFVCSGLVAVNSRFTIAVFELHKISDSENENTARPEKRVKRGVFVGRQRVTRVTR